MQIYFSTVVRTAPLAAGGEIVRLDWPTKTVTHKAAIDPTDVIGYDPNWRGNTRGGRGVALNNGQVIVASYHSLELYDLALNLQKKVTHGLMVGLHETCLDEEGLLWATATSIDALLGIDLDAGQLARQFWPREMPNLQKELGLIPRVIDKTADNRTLFLHGRHRRDPHHLHLNAVTVWQNEVFALFHDLGIVANLSQDKVVVHDPSLKKPHNLLISDDGLLIVNNTLQHAVHFYDLPTGELVKVIDLRQFKWVRDLIRWKKPGFAVRSRLNRLKVFRLPTGRPLFARGLDLVGNRLFVGISPASILCLDWQQGTLLDAFSYSRDVRYTIHGLKVWTNSA